MVPPKTCGDLSALLDSARREFFREVGDSANAVVLDSSEFGWLLPELAADDRGRPVFAGLSVVFADSPLRPVLLAKLVDPLDECESCRGL